MALVKCPDCGKMVSPRVAACPECGCPAEFFVSSNETPVLSNLPEGSEVIPTEYKVFKFKENCCIKYPVNSEKFANLYGDYLKRGFEYFKQLCDYYKQLGSADSVATQFGVAVQMINQVIIPNFGNNKERFWPRPIRPL